jgi:hypothetical protein
MRTFEEVRELLSQKISKEKKRLKTFGTKADSFNLANAITRHVQALMSESRASELKRLDKKLIDIHESHDKEKIVRYVNERLKATSDMAKAIQHTAEDTEKKRPWRSEVEQDIDKKEHKHKHRHGHSRSSRSSRH